MKGNEESVARCDAAMSPVIDSVRQHLPGYDERAVCYGFRRAWEIRDAEEARPTIEEQVAFAKRCGPGSLPYLLLQDMIENPEAAVESARGLAFATDEGTHA